MRWPIRGKNLCHFIGAVGKQGSLFKQSKSLLKNFLLSSDWKIKFSSGRYKCSSTLANSKSSKGTSQVRKSYCQLWQQAESQLCPPSPPSMVDMLVNAHTLTAARPTWIRAQVGGGMRKRGSRIGKGGITRVPFSCLFFSPSSLLSAE